jgi:hypothetical protein
VSDRQYSNWGRRKEDSNWGRRKEGTYFAEFFFSFVVKHADCDPATEDGVIWVVRGQVPANSRVTTCDNDTHRRFQTKYCSGDTHAQVSAHKLSRSADLMPLLAPASLC